MLNIYEYTICYIHYINNYIEKKKIKQKVFKLITIILYYFFLENRNYFTYSELINMNILFFSIKIINYSTPQLRFSIIQYGKRKIYLRIFRFTIGNIFISCTTIYTVV